MDANIGRSIRSDTHAASWGLDSGTRLLHRGPVVATGDGLLWIMLMFLQSPGRFFRALRTVKIIPAFVELGGGGSGAHG
jgi:hypothetical protein